jgi:replication factor A1
VQKGVDMNSELELTPHIEDLTWALGESIDSQQLLEELRNCLDNYGLSLNEAKRCVVKKFGKDPQMLGNVVDKTIIELTGTENNVNLLCRIIYIDEKEVTVEGKPKKITFGILADQTGTVPFTAWQQFDCDKGDVIRIYNAYSRIRNSKTQINFGNKTHVRLLPQDALPKTRNNGDSKRYSVNEFKEGIGNVKSVVRILDLEERNVNVKGEQKQIFRGYAADETGKCRFAAWSDFKLQKDDVVEITGGYIKAWRGLPELQLNGGTIVEKLEDDTLPDLKELSKDRIMTVRNLQELGGAASVAVEGIVLDIRPGSGLIIRCPECNRVLQNNACMVHGKVDGEYDLRIKSVLDDGTGALGVILNREITERILGLDLNACKNLAKEHMSTEVIFDQLIEKLLARPLRMSGLVISDEFGLMMIGKSAEIIVPKIKAESLNLLEELGINVDNEV